MGRTTRSFCPPTRCTALTWPAKSMAPMLSDEFQPNKRQFMLGSQVLSSLQQITDLSQKQTVSSQFLDSVVTMLQTSMGFPLVAVELYNPSVNRLTVAATTGPRFQGPENRLILSDTDSKLSLATQVFTNKNALVHVPAADDLRDRDLEFPFHT